MNNYKKPKLMPNQSASELRTLLLAHGESGARKKIAAIFDEGTFVETSAYMKRAFSDFFTTDVANEFEGVITGYGAVDGKLVFAFVEDASRMGGHVDERHAKKISDLYTLALKNGAPVIGVFNSNGTNIFEGTSGLAAYGRILATVNSASGKIPQIAYVAGQCIGTSAAIAATFDFVIKESTASLYVSSPTLTNNETAQDAIITFEGNDSDCAGYTRSLISFLPCNSTSGIAVNDCADNLNRLLGDLDFSGESLAEISVIADNGIFYELNKDYAPEMATAFATVGGVRCGILANTFKVNEGKLTSNASKKASRFISFCDKFNLPIITLVDSMGLDIDPVNEYCFSAELAKLASSYTSANCPKITVIMGHAIGASFVLLGSKSLGADLVYALENSEIGALSAESGVAFAWDKYITEEKTREDLIAEWKSTVSSVANAAASGEIDDIISTNELRARLCSSLMMLATKGAYDYKSGKILPL